MERLAAIKSHLEGLPRSQRLKNKVCIITGAGSRTGIGRASSLRFAHEGAKALYLLDLQKDGLQELKALIKRRYPDVKVTILEADAADETAIKALCQHAVEEEGHLDIFFANAGKATGAPLQDVDGKAFQELLRINTLSCFLAVKYASEAMNQTSYDNGKLVSGGSIILTASVAGLRAGAGSIDYSASKAAVISLAQLAANQLAGTNIRVNAVLPGLIETEMTSLTFDYARSRGTAAKIGQLNPLRRYGIAEEIAEAVLFLASDEASYVNGVALPVDGGLQSSLPVVPGKAF